MERCEEAEVPNLSKRKMHKMVHFLSEKRQYNLKSKYTFKIFIYLKYV